MNQWLPLVFTSVVSVLASSGFWAYVQSRSVKTKAINRLILGLAYDKVVTLGMMYIEAGSLTRDQYEDFRLYFYEPYREAGGNGIAERIMTEVSQLPLRQNNRYVTRSEGSNSGQLS